MKNEKHKKIFLKELENIPNVSLACKKCNISRNTIYKWRIENEEFKKDFEKAMRKGDDSITDLAKAKYVELIKNGHWKAIERQLNKNSEGKETALDIHDKTILEYRKFLEDWRNNKEFNSLPKEQEDS
ncbi:hypothetical protein M0Q39_04915 [Patescibacteria group bacterium]|nr:hypothetical protein [Patescibacteria group bacterium]MDD3940101.1 hypothetical protein [Candidatus Paceibacterota bacterium]